MNTLGEIAEERGYPCLDLMDNISDYNLDLEMDFFNEKHTNIHGSKKITDYIAEYLIENYHFEDKRSQKGWESWDIAAKNYMEFLSPYVFPFEFDDSLRVNTEIPKIKSLKINDFTATLTWKKINGVTGYEIYRKSTDGWEMISKVESGTETFEDNNLDPKTEYSYTVVPVIEKDNVIYYGDFNVSGLTAKTGNK